MPSLSARLVLVVEVELGAEEVVLKIRPAVVDDSTPLVEAETVLALEEMVLTLVETALLVELMETSTLDTLNLTLDVGVGITGTPVNDVDDSVDVLVTDETTEVVALTGTSSFGNMLFTHAAAASVKTWKYAKCVAPMGIMIS